MAFSSLAIPQGCSPRVHLKQSAGKGLRPAWNGPSIFWNTFMERKNQRLTKTKWCPHNFPFYWQRLTSFFHHFCLVHMGMTQNWGSLWSHSVGQCWRARDGEEYDLLCVWSWARYLSIDNCIYPLAIIAMGNVYQLFRWFSRESSIFTGKFRDNVHQWYISTAVHRPN